MLANFNTVIFRTSDTTGLTCAVWPYRRESLQQSRLASLTPDGRTTTFATMNYHQLVRLTRPATASESTPLLAALAAAGHSPNVAHRLDYRAYNNR